MINKVLNENRIAYFNLIHSPGVDFTDMISMLFDNASKVGEELPDIAAEIWQAEAELKRNALCDKRPVELYLMEHKDIIDEVSMCAAEVIYSKGIDHMITLVTQLGVYVGIQQSSAFEEVQEFQQEEDDPIICIYATIDGETVGHGNFDPNEGYFRGVETIREYRRNGVATAMYDYLDSLGLRPRASDHQEPDGVAFWNARGRYITLASP